MSLSSRKAAQTLLGSENYRSSISRSYYAAPCAVTEALADKVTFAYGGNNPPHDNLPNLVAFNLTVLDKPARREVQAALRRLWKVRVEADYIPQAYINRGIALNALRDASRILLILKTTDEPKDGR